MLHALNVSVRSATDAVIQARFISPV